MSDSPIRVTIYHNPACGTSRNTLALIRNAGVEPTVIEYLKTPPDRATLQSLLHRMSIRPRELLRQKGTPYDDLGLAADHWTDTELIEHMLAHPSLINRPIVITPVGSDNCAAHRRNFWTYCRSHRLGPSPKKMASFSSMPKAAASPEVVIHA